MSRSSSTFSTSSPSWLRTTMAFFSGPRIRMPSMSACPPMLVRKAQDCVLFCHVISFLIPYS